MMGTTGFSQLGRVFSAATLLTSDDRLVDIEGRSSEGSEERPLEHFDSALSSSSNLVRLCMSDPWNRKLLSVVFVVCQTHSPLLSLFLVAGGGSVVALLSRAHEAKLRSGVPGRHSTLVKTSCPDRGVSIPTFRQLCCGLAMSDAIIRAEVSSSATRRDISSPPRSGIIALSGLSFSVLPKHRADDIRN